MKGLLFLFFLLVTGLPVAAFSVLSHQAIIDAVWEPALVPLLKQRFPQADKEALREAHAHAYGGAIIQDMGYYPFGSKAFTDLTHYVRSGDFVVNLIREARSLPEYAFALGAMAHYYADNYGHSMATNKAVPLVYPEMKAAFGEEVTYEEDPLTHIKMEFGFDVLQVARGNYAPESYHRFIGFEVSRPVLERAFTKTYGLSLKEQFVSLDLAIGTYRRTVSTLIPDLTRAAWRMKKNDIQKARPNLTQRQFQYRIRRSVYHQKWGDNYQQPNLWHRFLSCLLRLLPRLGPNRAMAFKLPTPEAEKLFMMSFNAIVDHYSAGLKSAGSGKLVLDNIDLDTGRPIEADVNQKADEAYAGLLQQLDKVGFEQVSPDLRKHILWYYQQPKAAATAKQDPEKWQKLSQDLQKLKQTDTP